jgi:polyphosphate kinase
MSKKTPRQGTAEAAATGVGPVESKKERNRRYEAEVARLQVEIAYLQAWVKASGARVVILFEGRDAAGRAA